MNSFRIAGQSHRNNMLKLIISTASFALLAGCAVVPPINNSPPSEASVKQLMEVTQSRKLVENSLNQMDSGMRAMTDQMLKGHPISVDQQAKLDKMRVKVEEMVKQNMSWDNLEPTFIGIYQQSLTQSDVDGMLAFYSTPAGQSMVSKLPIIQQNAQAAMRQKMLMLMPELMKLVTETAQSE